MRVALISDLHGNELALRSVLARIDHLGVDQLVCLGDVATLGPRPHAVLKLLRESGCPVVMGNHDEFMLDAQLIHTYSEAPPVVQAVDWCREQLDEAELTYVRTFVRDLRVDLGHGRSLYCFHGTPRSHMEDLLATTPVAELDDMLGDAQADVMAMGHTHVQMCRQHRGRLLVNPGSLGQPFEQVANGAPPVVLDHAEFAIVEADEAGVRVQLERLSLERSALREQASSTTSPIGPFLVAAYS
jgi:putative phosphoesterase